MSVRAPLPELTRLTFGTGKVEDKDNPQHRRTVRQAMEAGVWFHTSHAYGNGSVFQTLRACFDEKPGEVPKLIVKVDGQGPDLLRQTVEQQVRDLGIERIDIAQLCGNPDVPDCRPDGAMHETMLQLQERGLVGNYVLEIFWPYSRDLLPAVRDEMFDAVIFYFNTVNREVDNPLWEQLEAGHTPILALRTLGGGPNSFHGPPDPDTAREQLDAIYEKSGCASRTEFRMRFVLSVPNVKTTIGATGKPEHLDELLEVADSFEPLPEPIVREIDALHRQWFAEKGMW